MRKMLLIVCLTLVGCGWSNSNVRSRTVVEDDDGTTLKRRVTTHEGEANALSLGLPPGAGYGYGYGGYDAYGGYGSYGYGGYGPYGHGRGIVMLPRRSVQVTTPIVISTTTAVTGGGPGGSSAKDAEQDKRIDRVERRTQDLRDVELRQECEKPENKDKKVCQDLNTQNGGK
jgi:hypothetical protein